MGDPRVDARFDELASQAHDWVDSAVALDEGHFPTELLSDLRDIISELKEYLDENEVNRRQVLELFATPEMAEVMQRFPRVRRMLESAWGTQFTDMLEEEGAYGYDADEEEEEE
jgi:hypothetical protein